MKIIKITILVSLLLLTVASLQAQEVFKEKNGLYSTGEQSAMLRSMTPAKFSSPPLKV